MNKLLNTLLALALVILVTSCGDDDTPIELGTGVTISNTFQSDMITAGNETTIEELFQLEAGALFSSSTISDNVEFPAYLLGLYDVDISESSISFELVAAQDDPTYKDLFRTLEAGTTDRYYLDFNASHNVESFTSNNSSVSLRIDSDNVLVVEIGEGFNFNPGSQFTITLN